MFFRFRLGIGNLLNLGLPMRIKGQGHNADVSLTFRVADDEEVARGISANIVFCIGELEMRPSKNASATVDAVWQRKLPPGFKLEDLSEEERINYSATGHINREFNLRQFEPAFQDFIDHARRKLVAAASEAMGATCWRLALNGPEYWYRLGGLEWSVNGKDWRLAPAKYVVLMDRPEGLGADSQDIINHLLEVGYIEPLHHELFREAWRLSSNNPRSSLLIGMTALETAVKSLLVNLVPQANWLIMNLPSPPVFQIIRDYFPQLQTKATKEVAIAPSKKLIDEVQKWTKLRNDLTHGKGADLDTEKLEEFLRLVRDLLYQCDYWSGVDWALEHVRTETRKELFSAT